MKLRNLKAVLGGFRHAGAGCLVVSGVLNSDRGVRAVDWLGAELLVCRLRADHDGLSRRFAGRDGSFSRADDARREAEALDRATFADVVVDTTNLAVEDVVGKVREAIGPWPPTVAQQSGFAPGGVIDAGQPDGQILWLAGPTGVGKSTTGFRLYLKVLGLDLAAAYVDVDQLGFCSTVLSEHHLRAENLAAVWSTYRASGADALVVVGAIRSERELSAYEQALPHADFSWCRLEAGRQELTRRVLTRQLGGSWSQPGDP